MAKFTLQTHNLCFLSQQHNPVCKTSLKLLHLHRLPSKHNLKFRNLSSTQQNVKGSKRITKIISGLRVDEVEQKDPISDSELSSEAQSEDWPPWKNLPQRYKLIGTTSLAFIICNMDKVIDWFLLWFWLLIIVRWWKLEAFISWKAKCWN